MSALTEHLIAAVKKPAKNPGGRPRLTDESAKARSIYCTDAEHAEIKKLLGKMRKQKKEPLD